MRLASFLIDGRPEFGFVPDDETVAPVDSSKASGVEALLTWEPARRAELLGQCDRVDIRRVHWLPPVTRPTLVIGIGLNTKSHFEETSERYNRTPGDYPAYPRLFTRSVDSHVAHGQPILVPRASNRLDYEGEIAIVIGREGRLIARDQALPYIGGYACYNDGSVRDFQLHTNQVLAGKNFVASGAFGPWIVTADEISDPSTLTLETRVNGELRQSMTMDDLIFGFVDLIAYISTIFHLRPGDVIVTGSPAGIGALQGKFLRAGDIVEVSCPAIGTLRNPVADA